MFIFIAQTKIAKKKNIMPFKQNCCMLNITPKYLNILYSFLDNQTYLHPNNKTINS